MLPFFHVFAMTGVMNFGLSEGAEIIILPRFVLDDTVKLIAKSKPTVMPGVPTLFNAIMNHKDVKTLDLRSLKVCLSGGAPLPRRGQERLRGDHRRQAGRSLRPLGNVARRHLQSAGRSRQDRLDRPADARHDHLDP